MKTILITVASTLAVIFAILAALVAYEVQNMPRVYNCTRMEA